MNSRTAVLLAGIISAALWACCLQADQVVMQNGDRLTGRVLSMSADTVVLASDVLGKVNVPRQHIAALSFGTNGLPAKVPSGAPRTNSLAASVPSLPANPLPPTMFGGAETDSNLVRQIRDQMLAGNPAAAAKFDELADGLMSGKLNLDDLRRQAKAAADQLRELKRENPDVAGPMDAYLQVLDDFLNEKAGAPAVAAPASPPNAQPR